jgi:hypothetical protein
MAEVYQPAVDPAWRGLCPLGGGAALAAAIVFRRWLSAELGLLSSLGLLGGVSAPRSGAVRDWFSLLQAHPLIGLISLNGLDLVNYALVGLIVLGMYAALRKSAPGAVTVALGLAFTGIAVYFASNQAFSLLRLSRAYAAAATDAERSQLLAAGQALQALSDPLTFGSGVFWGFNLVTLAELIFAGAMLRTGVFSKLTAWIGLAANALGLGYFITVAFAPALTFIPLSASAPLLLVWYLLAGVRLLRLGRAG